MVGNNKLSETAPLLDATGSLPEAIIDPLSGGSDVNGLAHVGATTAQGYGTAERETDPAAEAADRERPVNLFQGLPDQKKQLKYIFPAVSIGIFLAAADQTLVASAAGKIGSDLHSLESTQWVATAYFLTLTSFQPLYGKLSDLYGRKECLLFAYLVFGLGCLWCGLSNTMGSLIAARAFAGIGGGGMTTLVSVIMSDIVPLRERGTWQGIVNIFFSAGASAGAPLGGILADSIGWKWSFLAQAPLCLIAFFAVFFALELPEREKTDWRTKIRRVDFFGALTLIISVSFLLIGLDRGSNVSWTSKLTLSCLGVAAVLIAAFFFIELRVAQDPFAPGRIIFDRNLAGAFGANFFSFGAVMGALFHLPIYYQSVQGRSATEAGLLILPGVMTGVWGSLGGGLIMQRTGKYYWLTVCSYALFTLATIPMILFTGPVMHSTLGLCIGLAFSSLGNGSGVTTTLIALISTASPEDQAVTTACSYLFRSLGSVLGLAAEASVMQAVLRTQLRQRLGSGPEAEALAERVRQSLDYVKTLPLETQLIVRDAYSHTMPVLFGCITCIAAGSFVSSWFIKETRLS